MLSSSIPFFDRPISRLVIGSMAFSMENLDSSFETLDEYVRLGGNCIDTATVYGPSRHNLVGEYLKARGRNTLVILDKGCHPSNRKRVTKEDMKEDILANQERMGIDHTDLFLLHRDDPDVPVGAIVDWLNAHKEAGQISAFGGSNWTHNRIAEANQYAAEHGLQGFSLSSSNLALARTNEPMWAGALSLDSEERRWYETSQFPLFSWSSGAGGFFAGFGSDDVKRVYHNHENFARKDRATELADRYGVSPTQIAVAWTLNQPLNVSAIVGPKTPEEVRDNLGVVGLKLSPQELRYLEFGGENT